MLKKNIMSSCCLQTQAAYFIEQEIGAENVYEDFHRDRGLFDFSDYLRDSKFFDLAN